jgi:hypothetical protein
VRPRLQQIVERNQLTASAEGRVTLLYSSHDREHNNAVALKEYLDRRRHEYSGHVGKEAAQLGISGAAGDAASQRQSRAGHRTIEKVVRMIGVLADELAENRNIDGGILRDLCQFLRVSGHQCHYGKEEDYLYLMFGTHGLPEEQVWIVDGFDVEAGALPMASYS